MLKSPMNSQQGSIAQVPKLDTPLAIWAWFLWSALGLYLPGSLALHPVVPYSTELSFAGLILFFLACFILWKVLVFKGAERTELNAVTDGVFWSFAITTLIACAISLVILGTVVVSAKLLGFGDTIDHGIPLLAQVAFTTSLVIVCWYIGWRLKGKSVYVQRIRQLCEAGS